MNGVHDMGGMHGFGPIVVEENEPLFHEPWEGRAFGMAVALNEIGEYEWSEFQSMLTAEISDAEQNNDSSTY